MNPKANWFGLYKNVKLLKLNKIKVLDLMPLKTKALNPFCLGENCRYLMQTSFSEPTPLKWRKQQDLLIHIAPIWSIQLIITLFTVFFFFKKSIKLNSIHQMVLPSQDENIAYEVGWPYKKITSVQIFLWCSRCVLPPVTGQIPMAVAKDEPHWLVLTKDEECQLSSQVHGRV